jgi:tetratricopeptide (TPR) repeat protein
MTGRVRIALLLLAAAAQVARAEEPRSPAQEIARRQLDLANAFFAAGRYLDAIHAFDESQDPPPRFYFLVGECWERLNDPEKALAAYRSYLAVELKAKDYDEVRSRVRRLRETIEERKAAAPATAIEPPQTPPKPVEEAPAPPTPPAVNPVPAPAMAPVIAPPSQGSDTRPRFGPMRIAAIATGGAALVLAIAASGLLASVSSDFDALQASCRGLCVPQQWADVESRANASYALWGIAAVAVAADAILWVLDLRRARSALTATTATPRLGLAF